MISMTGVHKIVPLHRDEEDALAAFGARRGGGAMNKLRLSTGHEVPLDGDLLAVLEGLYREVTLKRQFKGSFEDMMREIEGLVEQMSPEDRRRYLVESLFLNYNTYESEMLDAYCAAAHREEEGPRAGRREAGGEAALRPALAWPRSSSRSPRAPRRSPRRPADPGGAGELRLRQGPAGKDPARRTSRSATSATRELVIEGVSTTCGCTAALAAQSRVEPGGRDRAAGHVRDPQLLGEGGARACSSARTTRRRPSSRCG